LPGNRKPVQTAVRSQSKHKDVYRFMQQQLEDGGQAYVVYPLVEESEKMDLKDATAGFEKLKESFRSSPWVCCMDKWLLKKRKQLCRSLFPMIYKCWFLLPS